MGQHRNSRPARRVSLVLLVVGALSALGAPVALAAPAGAPFTHPVTGTSVGLLIGAGLLLLAVGVAAVLLARRRSGGDATAAGPESEAP